MQIIHHILIVISVIIGILAIYALIHRKTKFGLTYFILLLAIFIYSLGYSFEIESTTISEIYKWLRIQYLGISWLPTIFLILAIQYTGHSKLLRNWLIIVPFIISTLTLIFQVTNWNHLFYTEFLLDEKGPFILANFKKGAWYWIHQIYSNFTFLISSIIYLNMMLSSAGINRIRSGIMFLTAIIPWIFYIIYLLGYSPYNIDLNPFSVAFVGILGYLGIFKFQLLDFEPLAIESIFKNMSEGVIIIDNQKRLMLFNEMAEKIFPNIHKNIIGINITPILSSYFDIDVFLKTNTNEPFEFSINHENITCHYQIKWSNIHESKKRAAGITLIITDITKRKEIEKKLEINALELRELNQNMTRFLAILGHDLRNPLNILLNFSEILNSEIEGKVDKSTQKIAQALNDTSFSISFLTENLLKWSQLLREGMVFNPQKANINSIIYDEIRLLDTLSKRKNINITTQLGYESPITIDSNMIRTVLRNLITNAIKFSFEKGEVQIKTSIHQKYLMVEIIDHGIGVQDKEKKNIFYIDNIIIKKGTASETGTGLGLIICKELIQKHHGSIGIKDTQGQGSTFWFSLPL